jgi:membrane protease YdiL (CAAX protease family)
MYGTISVGLFGAASALLYLATRSLTNAILLHMLYNLTITVPMWMLYHSPS